MKIIMKIIYENCGVKNYVKEDHRSYTYTTFAVGERKPFAVAFITVMIFFHACNCLCIVCINVAWKLWYFLSSSFRSSLTIRCSKSRVPFYDNLYSLQNRKTRPLNFLCFSRDACGIKTKPFVPTTDTVDQRPNVSPLVTFAELTSTFFVHVLYWNIFQILLKGRRATERKRELKVWSEKNNKPWYHPCASPGLPYSLPCLLLW